MSRIKLMTDTTSDIPAQVAKELDITIMHVPVAVDGKGYLEGLDFTCHEFYDILLNAKEMPSTSRVNAAAYEESYLLAAQEGVTDLINVTLNAGGSGTNESAHLALAAFQKKHPELADQMQVTIIDSRSYSFAYGYPVMEAAKMARANTPVQEILDYLNDWLDSAEIFLACYTLDFAKKSGRIPAAAAFVGELLGLRPIIWMTEGRTDVLEKVRGDKNVVPGVCRLATEAIVKDGEYIIMKGMLDPPADDLAAAMTDSLGYAPKGIYNLGPSVSINAGPKVVAVVVRGKKRT